MFTKARLEKIAEWATRLALIPFALYGLVNVIKELGSQEAMPLFGGDLLGLFGVGLLWYAIFYPAPPWRNEPLKMLISYLLYVLVFVAGVVGNILASAYILYRSVQLLFGPSAPMAIIPGSLMMLLLGGLFIGLCIAEYKLVMGLLGLYDKHWGQERKNSEKSPKAV